MDYKTYINQIENTTDEMWLAETAERLLELSKKHHMSIHIDTVFCSEDNVSVCVNIFSGKDNDLIHTMIKDGSEMLGIINKAKAGNGPKSPD